MADEQDPLASVDDQGTQIPAGAQPSADEDSAHEGTRLPVGTPSDDMRAHIVNQRNRGRSTVEGTEDELREALDANGNQMPAAADSPGEPAGVTPAPAATLGDTPSPAPITDPVDQSQTHQLVKVFKESTDGFVGMVPNEEIAAAGGLEAYSKRLAADIKLARADRIEAEATARFQRAEQATQQSAAPTGPPAVELDAEGLSSAQRAELEQLGDEYPEQMVTIAKKQYQLENRLNTQPDPAGTPTTIDEIADQVLARTTQAQRAARLNEANQWFSEHYGHIEADSDLAAIAKNRISTILADQPDADFLEVVKSAGEHAEAFRQRGPAPVTPPTNSAASTASVVERKRILAGSQPPNRTSRMPPAQEAPAPTRQQTIQAIRQARGQPA